MKINFIYDDDVTVNELFDLMDRTEKAVGDRFPARNVFHRNLRNEESEAKTLKNTIAVTARNNDCLLIGYLRILTDGAYIFYILDVMVDPDERGSGIGSKLVELAVAECEKGGFIKIFLTALPGKEDFYAKFGYPSTSCSPLAAACAGCHRTGDRGAGR